MSAAPDLSKCYRPPAVARRWGVKASRVLTYIRRGELRGFALPVVNHDPRRQSRPRFLVSAEALAAFEAAHQIQPKTPTPRRRRNAAPPHYA